MVGLCAQDRSSSQQESDTLLRSDVVLEDETSCAHKHGCFCLLDYMIRMFHLTRVGNSSFSLARLPSESLFPERETSSPS